MKFTKMLGFAGVVVLAAMAFISAGTASAESACLEDPKELGALGKCAEGKIWEGPIFGLASNVTFTINHVPIPCKKSQYLADWISNEGAKVGVLYLILTLSFEECTKCTVKVENPPYFFLILMTPNLHGIITEDKNKPPAILFENCDIGGTVLNCLYEALKETLLSYVLEIKEIEKVKVPLDGAFAWNGALFRGGDSPLCEDEARIEATYLTYEDVNKVEGAELFFTASP